VLDVGSADGPSVEWLSAHAGQHVTLDIDPRGLGENGVCGSAMELPFADGTFDVVGAFDVIEHCSDEAKAVQEIARVLAPGGRVLISVPAYRWAWTSFDVQNGHHRRYTRRRAVQALEGAGLEIQRATYAFSAVFPMFATQRLVTRAQERLTPRSAEPQDVVPLPEVSPRLSSILLRLCRLDEQVLMRGSLPFGSSVVVAATKAADRTYPADPGAAEAPSVSGADVPIAQ
jgi:SAM-dependent methyltransferase